MGRRRPRAPRRAARGPRGAGRGKTAPGRGVCDDPGASSRTIAGGQGRGSGWPARAALPAPGRRVRAPHKRRRPSARNWSYFETYELNEGLY
jgi:hypothetical protein